ncbi:MAG TPA: hypothetical protein DEB13_00835 [Candidatus Yanofskybacteria bacterium]|nr:hypothetical protein [Candidatus Yanofskybacteria bacterium]
MRKVYCAATSLIVILAIGYFGFYMTSTVVAPTPTGTPTDTPLDPTKTNPTPMVTGSEISIEGVLDCVPYKSTSGIQPGSCQIGLKAKDSKYYALSGLEQDDVISGKFSTGSKVKIVGILIKKDAPNIDVAGTIKITSIK